MSSLLPVHTPAGFILSTHRHGSTSDVYNGSRRETDLSPHQSTKRRHTVQLSLERRGPGRPVLFQNDRRLDTSGSSSDEFDEVISSAFTTPSSRSSENLEILDQNSDEGVSPPSMTLPSYSGEHLETSEGQSEISSAPVTTLFRSGDTNLGLLSMRGGALTGLDFPDEGAQRSQDYKSQTHQDVMGDQSLHLDQTTPIYTTTAAIVTENGFVQSTHSCTVQSQHDKHDPMPGTEDRLLGISNATGVICDQLRSIHNYQPVRVSSGNNSIKHDSAESNPKIFVPRGKNDYGSSRPIVASTLSSGARKKQDYLEHRAIFDPQSRNPPRDTTESLLQRHEFSQVHAECVVTLLQKSIEDLFGRLPWQAQELERLDLHLEWVKSHIFKISAEIITLRYGKAGKCLKNKQSQRLDDGHTFDSLNPGAVDVHVSMLSVVRGWLVRRNEKNRSVQGDDHRNFGKGMIADGASHKGRESSLRFPNNVDSQEGSSQEDSQSSQEDSDSSQEDSDSSQEDSDSNQEDSDSSQEDSDSSQEDSQSSQEDSHSRQEDSHFSTGSANVIKWLQKMPKSFESFEPQEASSQPVKPKICLFIPRNTTLRLRGGGSEDFVSLSTTSDAGIALQEVLDATRLEASLPTLILELMDRYERRKSHVHAARYAPEAEVPFLPIIDHAATVTPLGGKSLHAPANNHNLDINSLLSHSPDLPFCRSSCPSLEDFMKSYEQLPFWCGSCPSPELNVSEASCSGEELPYLSCDQSKDSTDLVSPDSSPRFNTPVLTCGDDHVRVMEVVPEGWPFWIETFIENEILLEDESNSVSKDLNLGQNFNPAQYTTISPPCASISTRSSTSLTVNWLPQHESSVHAQALPWHERSAARREAEVAYYQASISRQEVEYFRVRNTHLGSREATEQELREILFGLRSVPPISGQALCAELAALRARILKLKRRLYAESHAESRGELQPSEKAAWQETNEIFASIVEDCVSLFEKLSGAFDILHGSLRQSTPVLRMGLDELRHIMADLNRNIDDHELWRMRREGGLATLRSFPNSVEIGSTGLATPRSLSSSAETEGTLLGDAAERSAVSGSGLMEYVRRARQLIVDEDWLRGEEVGSSEGNSKDEEAKDKDANEQSGSGAPSLHVVEMEGDDGKDGGE